MSITTPPVSLRMFSNPAGGFTSVPEPELIHFLSFDEGVLPEDWNPDGGGATLAVSSDTSQNYCGSAGSVHAHYPLNVEGYNVYAVVDLSDLDTDHLYIRFRAKMPSPTKGGCKFIKIFGDRPYDNPSNFANTTVGPVYSTGSLEQISFGDGSTTGNDIAEVVILAGGSPGAVGRSIDHGAVVETPMNKSFGAADWGTDWHLFEFYAKFNSGTSPETEVNDGAYMLAIDGNVYARATRLFNRHWSNGPINRIEFFGWSNAPHPEFDLWYDDIEIWQHGFGVSPAERKVFAQDFENNSFSVGNGAAAITNAAHCSISTSASNGGTRSAKCDYSIDGTAPEIRYVLTTPVPALTVEWDLLAPVGYVGNRAGTQNLQFVHLWGSETTGADGDGYDSSEKAGFSLWGKPEYVQADWGAAGGNGGAIGPQGATYADLIQTEDEGIWLQFKCYYSPPKATGQKGSLRLWKRKSGMTDWTLILDGSNKVDNFDPAAHHDVAHFTLLGSSNTGFQRDMSLHIDNVRAYAGLR